MTSTAAPLPVRLGTSLGRHVRGWMPPVEQRVNVATWIVVVGLLVLVVGALARTDMGADGATARGVPYDEWFRPPWLDAVLGVAPGLERAFPPVVLVGHVLAVLALPLARSRPLLATAVASLPFATIPLYGTFVLGWWWALAGVAVVAGITRLRAAVPAFVLAVGIIAVWNAVVVMEVFDGAHLGSLAGGTAGWWTVLGFATYLGAAIAVGAALGSGLRLSASVGAARAAEREAVLATSATAERAALARDLHDVVAHHISLIAVRAESAPFVHPDLSPGAKAVLADIAADARSSLAEMQQALGVLRRSEEAARTPQPDATDVPELVAEARTAGQRVELAGAWAEVPPSYGYVLYRSVQEGLTNARRHAPGAPVTLVRQQRGDIVGFRLTNPCDAHDVAVGRGLAGMRERVESLGGALEVSSRGGRFTLVVVLRTGQGR